MIGLNAQGLGQSNVNNQNDPQLKLFLLIYGNIIKFK